MKRLTSAVEKCSYVFMKGRIDGHAHVYIYFFHRADRQKRPAEKDDSETVKIG